MVTTPAMLLNLPDVGITPGPLWASMLNQAFFDIDSHDHSSNKGVQITPAGLNIDSDLPFNSNNAVTLRSTKYDNQGAFLPNIDVRAIYVKGGDLFYNNNLGQPVKITSGTTLNITGIGSIGGDYGQPGVQAAVTYSDITKIYLFVQSPGVTGGIACGPLTVFENTIGANGITIRTPAGLGAAYTLRLPPSLPIATNEIAALNPTGNLTTGNACFSAGGITSNKFLNTNDVFSSSDNMLTATQGTTVAIGGTTRAAIAWDTSALSMSYVRPGTSTVMEFVPVGAIMMWLTGTMPNGWLLLNGQAVSRTDFAKLFALWGTTYGIGDGVTTFNLPNWQSRVPVGAGQGPANYLGDVNPLLTNHTLATAFGRETHTLITAETPSHAHDKGTYQIAGSGLGLHSHLMPIQPTGAGVKPYLATTAGAGGTLTTTFSTDAYFVGTGSSDGSHEHPNSEWTGSSGSIGGDGAHNNLQPGLTCNFIVKY